MAKRKYSKKSSNCPEPFNTLIDIAAAMTMGAVANHMEKKYRYSAKGKINPYAVSAFGIGSGRMRSTEDLLRTGAVLGAMGSFDVEAERPVSISRYVLDDPVFKQIKETRVNDNRYAWRMNCEDGSAYGISPFDYETRSQYNAALLAAKGGEAQAKKEPTVETESPKNQPSHRSNPFLCCRVSRLDNGANEFYLTEDETIKVGDCINVQTNDGYSQGIVIGVKRLSDMTADEIPNEAMWVITEVESEDDTTHE